MLWFDANLNEERCICIIYNVWNVVQLCFIRGGRYFIACVFIRRISLRIVTHRSIVTILNFCVANKVLIWNPRDHFFWLAHWKSLVHNTFYEHSVHLSSRRRRGLSFCGIAYLYKNICIGCFRDFSFFLNYFLYEILFAYAKSSSKSSINNRQVFS